MDGPRPLADDTEMRRGRDAVAAEVDEQVVILVVTSGEYLTLNPTGARIWRRLELPTTVAALCTELGARYSVSAQACRRDVEAFIAAGCEQGLFEVTAR